MSFRTPSRCGAATVSIVRRVGRGALWPVRRLLDPRFADVNRRLASTQGALAAVAGSVNEIVGSYAESQLESTSFVGAQLRALEGAVQDLRGDTEALRVELAALADAHRGGAVRQRFAELTGGRIEDLDLPAADLINYASSHRGFAAQAELWLNPPLVLAHGEGEVRLASVNERIVELAFAASAIAQLQPGARVLDFGSSESSLALTLASLGFTVTALDLRTYPFEHPHLTVVASPIEQWAAEPRSFDAALCVSTVEHVGLGWYGGPRHEEGGDRRALDRICELLVPGGLLVLSVPYGAPSVDALQRRYDHAQLDALVEGWEILQRQVIEQVDERIWQPVEDSNGVAVALVMARKPASA
jgi:2-polyprenyl-3-methyl-5-hydroxy-6-metoxy-1,4-benzoquinol methylase